jgi:hypothetical protein
MGGSGTARLRPGNISGSPRAECKRTERLRAVKSCYLQAVNSQVSVPCHPNRNGFTDAGCHLADPGSDREESIEAPGALADVPYSCLHEK